MEENKYKFCNNTDEREAYIIAKIQFKKIIKNFQETKFKDNFDELFKSLYERASEYLQNKEGTAAILINEHQYKANFRIDKEINTMSLIQQILNNK